MTDAKNKYIRRSVCNTTIGSFLEDSFRKITMKKWTTKFKDLKKEDFDIAMKSTKNTSKHHPQNFQKTVINKLDKNYEEIINKFHLETLEQHA